MEEYHSDMESDSEKEFRRAIKRKMGIGALMCGAGPLFLIIMIFLAQFTLPASTVTILFITLVAIGFLGMVIVLYYGMGSSMLFRGMDILRRISPPEPFIAGKFVVLNRDPVYGIAQWGSNALFFVAFYQSERTFEQKVSVPRVIWKWEYSHPVGEIKVARREGDFTIPVDRDTYYKGRGILYSLLLEETIIVSIRKNYTVEQLNLIVDKIAQEVMNFGSGSQLFDDDFQ
jgi:hypothetical protein